MLAERRAKIFKALGHPSRMAIVEALCEGEKCVCELQPVVGAEMSTVSKHLSQLREAGVLQMRKEGTNVYYSLRMACVRSFLQCVDAFLGEEARGQLQLLAPKIG